LIRAVSRYSASTRHRGKEGVKVSNLNSVVDVIMQHDGQPIALSMSTTGHRLFQAGGSAVVLVLNATTSSETALPFVLRVGGRVLNCTRYQIDVTRNAALEPVIATTGLVAGPSGPEPDSWLLEIKAMWDRRSQFLRGIFYGWAGGTAISLSALLPSLGKDPTELRFGVAVTVPVACSNADFLLTEFSAEFI
jgi:hypothetical protein